MFPFAKIRYNDFRRKYSQNYELKKLLKFMEVSMGQLIASFQIPTLDMNRACAFYSAVLELDIRPMEFNGNSMALIPGETMTGRLVRDQTSRPSTDGTMIYLDGGQDLSQMLDRVEPAGGKTLTPKTQIAPNMGCYALFEDTEGNRIGILSRG
jgi:uncharacterized protein